MMFQSLIIRLNTSFLSLVSSRKGRRQVREYVIISFEIDEGNQVAY